MSHRLVRLTRFRRLSSVIAVSLTAAGIYATSRPCVIGPCPLVTQPQPVDRVSELLTPTATSEDIVYAYDLLLKTIVDLNRIPVWSSRHGTAQAKLQIYTTQADSLAKLVSAQRYGQQAAIASQAAPHPLRTWQEIQRDWQSAIAELKQVPVDAPGFDVAQHKLREYAQNRDAIEQRIAIEQQAQSKIAEARKAASLAEARATDARTPNDWQQVFVTWQVVLDRLGQVNPHSMAYAEAQQLDALYRPQRQAAQQQQRQEDQSATAYQQAMALSQQAQNLEQQGQWPQAIAHWKQAVEQLEQVPEGTAYFDQAQPLTHAYTKSLEQAQQGLLVATAMQTSRADFDSACRQLELCGYTAASHAVQIRVAESHDQAVAQAIRTQRGGELDAAQEVRQLVLAMASIGAAIQIPIELYDAAGQLIATYQPNIARYVTPEGAKPAIAQLST